MNYAIKIGYLILSSVGIYFAHLLTLAKVGGEAPMKVLEGCGQGFWDCTTINGSPMSMMLGLPTATWGMLFYFAVLGLTLLLFLNHEALSRGVTRLLGYVAAFGLLFSLFLFTYSLVEFGKLCLYCTYTYVVNLLLLGLAVFHIRRDNVTHGDFMKGFTDPMSGAAGWLRYTSLPVAVFIGVLVYAGAAGANEDGHAHGPHDGHNHGHNHGKKHDSIKSFVKDVLSQYDASETYTFDVTGRPWKGSETPVLNIVEFADYNCGHCGRMAQTLKMMENTFPGQLRITFINFPLDNVCNDSMGQTRGGSSCFAAAAAVCAGQNNQERFWDMHDIIFKNQTGLHKKKDLLGYAKDMGLNMGAFKQCMNSPNTTARLKDDAAQGDQAGVKGTPALYINGKKLPGVGHPMALRVIFEELIARETGQPSPLDKL